jgi:hypothetical protein
MATLMLAFSSMSCFLLLSLILDFFLHFEHF